MSKICEKCGNMIPDGVDICPNCGWEDDAAIAAVMNDLSKAFADLGAPEAVPSKPAIDPNAPTVEDDTILFRPEDIKEAEQGASPEPEDYDISSAIEAAMKQLSSDDQSADLENEPPKADPVPVQEPVQSQEKSEAHAPELSQSESWHTPGSLQEPVKPAPKTRNNPQSAAAKAKKPQNDAPKGKKTQNDAPKAKKPQEGAPKTKRPEAAEAKPAPKKKKRPEDAPRPKNPNGSGSHSSSAKKKKKKKKNSGKALLGVVIGLIVVLVIVVGAAFGMLYKLGFFESMSDDELLGITTPVVSEAPTPSPEVTLEASAPEVSVNEPETVLPGGSAVDENTPVDAEENIDVTKFKVTGAEYIIMYSRGETTEVVYVIEPSDAKKHIKWESSDETVATVSDYGVIAARRGGTCTITGTCGDASITVYVTCDFTVPSTVLDMNYEDVTMNHEGQTLELAIDYDLTSDQIKNTVWESSDETVATVDEDGVVTAVADGTAVITASIAQYTASCIVRCVNVTGNKGVNNSESEYVINYEDVTLSRKGEYFQLTLKSVVGNEMPAFTWKSSDTKVATVDSKGVVTAVANGTCKITTSVGGDNFECVVRVNISG